MNLLRISCEVGFVDRFDFSVILSIGCDVFQADTIIAQQNPIARRIGMVDTVVDKLSFDEQRAQWADAELIKVIFAFLTTADNAMLSDRCSFVLDDFS